MTGQDQIIAMRRNGQAPRYCWVSDFSDATLDGMTVRLAPDDVPEQQDFRFLVGLTAIVEGDCPIRVGRIAVACKATARRVIASVLQPINEYRWEVTGVTDTNEVLTWQN